jgi:hypothetical protein
MMKVRAIRNSFVDAPPHVAWSGGPRSQTYLTVNNEYEVYALVIYNGDLALLVVTDDGTEAIRSSWFFEIVERALPVDWQINLFNHGDKLQGLIGPEFFVRDGESYNALVECDPAALRNLADYIRKRELACPCCSIATLNKLGEYDICPTCGWVDDPYQRQDVSLADAVNKPSLTEAREIWKKTLRRLDD